MKATCNVICRQDGNAALQMLHESTYFQRHVRARRIDEPRGSIEVGCGYVEFREHVNRLVALRSGSTSQRGNSAFLSYQRQADKRYSLARARPFDLNLAMLCKTVA